jgi:hypothetical protein
MRSRRDLLALTIAVWLLSGGGAVTHASLTPLLASDTDVLAHANAVVVGYFTGQREVISETHRVTGDDGKDVNVNVVRTTAKFFVIEKLEGPMEAVGTLDVRILGGDYGAKHEPLAFSPTDEKTLVMLPVDLDYGALTKGYVVRYNRVFVVRDEQDLAAKRPFVQAIRLRARVSVDASEPESN